MKVVGIAADMTKICHFGEGGDVERHSSVPLVCVYVCNSAPEIYNYLLLAQIDEHGRH